MLQSVYPACTELYKATMIHSTAWTCDRWWHIDIVWLLSYTINFQDSSVKSINIRRKTTTSHDYIEQSSESDIELGMEIVSRGPFILFE